MTSTKVYDANMNLVFVHSFKERKKTAYENLFPPFKIQQFLMKYDQISVEDLMRWYHENNYTLELPSSKSDLYAFQECWNTIKGSRRGNYFRYRYATESYLSGIHLIKLAEGQTLVDIGCGTGHFASFYKDLCPTTTAIDAEITNLLILNRFFSDTTDLICTDLNASLGLDGKQFDSVFISDLFHYIIDKNRFLKELKTTWNSTGMIMFNHVHHLCQKNQEKGMGFPLSVTELRTLFDRYFSDFSVNMFGEHQFIQYALGRKTCLSEAVDSEESPLVIIIKDRNKTIDFRKVIPAPKRLMINNAYDLIFEGNAYNFKRNPLPTEFLDEFSSSLFPEQLVVDGPLIPIDKLFARGILINA